MKQTDLFILGMLFGSLLFWYCYRWGRGFRLQRKIRRAKRGEKQALDLLATEGYEIVELQKRASVRTIVDGQAYKTYIAADAVVYKDGRRFVAEIKTGNKATKVTHAPTRRQLLEYFYIFKPHGILLVDMEQKKICKVEFAGMQQNKRIEIGIIFFLCFLLGAIYGWYIRGGF